MIFYRLLTWMVFECLANSNDYKLNNKLCDLTSQKQKRVLLPAAAVFSVSHVAGIQRFYGCENVVPKERQV